jgi:hypothetical protein
MVKHLIEISEKANLKIKIYKSMNELNTVSEVIEKVLSDLDMVVE